MRAVNRIIYLCQGAHILLHVFPGPSTARRKNLKTGVLLLEIRKQSLKSTRADWLKIVFV